MRPAVERWLAETCASLSDARSAAVLFARGGGLQTIALWPGNQPVSAAMAHCAGAALGARRLVLQDVASGRLAALPLSAAGVLLGVVVVARDRQAAASAEVPAALERAAAAFEQALRPNAAAKPGDRDGEVLKLADEVFAQPDVRSACTAWTAAVAARFGAARVSLGLRQGGRTRIEGSSDGHASDERRIATDDLVAAMDEAIDEAEALVWPAAEDAPPRILLAHAAFGQRQGLAAVCSVPLVQTGPVRQVVGALTLEIQHGQPPDAAGVALLQAQARAITPWLWARREAARPVWQRLARGPARPLAALRGPGSLLPRLAAGSAAAALLALLLWPAAHEVRAEARLEGRTQRVLVAPGDAYLAQVLVRPGDRVEAGQLLLRFEGEDLRLQLQRLAAERAGEDAAVGDAMQRRDRARLATASARVQELDAQIALLDQRLARAELKAPIAGIVLSGDLSQQLGAPVQRGAPLLTLAPAEGFRAIVEVADRDIAEVRLGQPGSLVLGAQPDRAWPMRVVRITPLATTVDARAVFEVEVEIELGSAPPTLLPGMRGVARLHVGEKPLAQLWTRELLAWVRLAAWRWVA